MAQKLAPAEKNSTDISAASATFCISVYIIVTMCIILCIIVCVDHGVHHCHCVHLMVNGRVSWVASCSLTSFCLTKEISHFPPLAQHAIHFFSFLAHIQPIHMQSTHSTFNFFLCFWSWQLLHCRLQRIKILFLNIELRNGVVWSVHTILQLCNCELIKKSFEPCWCWTEMCAGVYW